MTTILRRLLLVSAIAVFAAACSTGADSTTTTTSTATADSGVVFGSGELPASVPAGFPIPDQAVVGTTMVDHNRGNTEMVLTFPADVTAVVAYYTDNLPGRGYEIVSSDGSETNWVIAFATTDVNGELRFQTGGSGLTAATVRFVGA